MRGVGVLDAAAIWSDAALVEGSMSYDQASVRQVLDRVKAERRTSLTPAESKILCDAYGIPLPQRSDRGFAARKRRDWPTEIGFPVVMKIVSPDILHKTDAGGVIVGVKSADRGEQAYESIVRNATAYKPEAKITGVQIQQMFSRRPGSDRRRADRSELRQGGRLRPRRSAGRGAQGRDVSISRRPAKPRRSR